MRIIHYISAALIGIISLSSCDEIIELELDNTYTRMVVDGILTTDTTSHVIKLRKSVDYDYGKALPPVTGAHVEISDGNSFIVLTEDPKTPGNYVTSPDYYGVAGKTYTLTISNVDIDEDSQMESYSARDVLLPVEKIDSIRVVPSDFPFATYDIRFWAKEPGNSRDYYLFKVRKNGTMLTDTITETFPSDDIFYNGKNLYNITVYNLRKNHADEVLNAGDTVMLEMASISKAFNQFLVDLQFETQGSSPFGGQPANLSTNFDNKDKVMGFFATYAVSRSNYFMKDEDIIPEEELTN